MTERKFTDEEVIKALEHAMYSAKGEDGFKELHWEMLKDFLDLINRRNAEINILIRKHDTLRDEITELQADIDKQYEQARADILGNMADGGTSCHWCIEQHETKAIKEFAEEFEKRCIKSGIYPVITKNILKNLVKEKTEEQS